MSDNNLSKSDVKVRTRLLICAAVILAGLLGMFALGSLKKPPAEMPAEERPIRVEAVRVEAEDVPVAIEGYGEVRALNTVSIAPEVSVRIEEIHARLERGEVIPEGEVLFRIDPRDYQAAYDAANATVRQLESSITRLRNQHAINQDRLKTLERNRDLAREELTRLRTLFEKDSVGTRSGVDAAERAANSAADLADQLKQAVLLYPVQLREAESSLAVAQANREAARARLERCTVRAPFEARIKAVSLETGQYVMPGQNVLTLADDSFLEVQVPLDSRDARLWLRFALDPDAGDTAWFGKLETVPCKIRWTENPEGHVWIGELQRVVTFDQQTRTLTVAVRVSGRNALSRDPQKLPLVEGMFCSVEIPGRTLNGVIRLPRWTVSFENTVYAAEDGRLKTVPVEVARLEEGYAFIQKGLQPGDVVIITRLVDPLENSLLDLKMKSIEEEGS